jgi:uncharacterized protein (DUF1800 family)
MGFPPFRCIYPVLMASLLLGACASRWPAKPMASAAKPAPVDAYLLTNRLTWGANSATLEQAESKGLQAYIAQQLHPSPAPLPPVVQQQIAAMTITQQPLAQLAMDMDKRQKEAYAPATNDDDKKAAQQAYQQELNRLGREAATRHLLRALYSPNQVQEQMTWFWLNHFNVHMAKANLRTLVGDYEDTALRPYALGRFRDLLGAVAHHPAMLRYLDNEQNAAGRINENYARELMELHTLGVGAGYTQQDVQEMARILTGVGYNVTPDAPKLRKELQADYVRKGLFEFNPNRHDYGPKTLLGQPIKSRGLAELDEALDRLAKHPATARFISRKLAQYWLSDTPPPALVERMAQTFLRSDGNMAATLQTLLDSPEFSQGAGQKFKDPMHYVVSAVRLAYDNQPVLNVGPMLSWLNRMGEPLYGHQTPDGYALDTAAWASPGQMATRFEIAKAIGTGNAGLFKTEGPQPVEKAAFPQLANALYYRALGQTLGPNTQKALAEATSPQEWNSFLLSSPELMHR